MELLLHLQHASPFPFHPAHAWSLPSLLINPFIVCAKLSLDQSSPELESKKSCSWTIHYLALSCAMV